MQKLWHIIIRLLQCNWDKEGFVFLLFFYSNRSSFLLSCTALKRQDYKDKVTMATIAGWRDEGRGVRGCKEARQREEGEEKQLQCNSSATPEHQGDACDTCAAWSITVCLSFILTIIIKDFPVKEEPLSVKIPVNNLPDFLILNEKLN